MSVRDTIRQAKPTVTEYTLKDKSKIWVRAFTGTGRAQYSAYVEKAKENGGIHAEVIAAMAICEQDGSPAYDWNNPEDLKELLEHLDGSDLDAIGMLLFETSGLTKKADEEAAKN